MDEIGLDDQIAGDRMAEQLVLVAGLGAAPFDEHALARRHEGAVAAFLETGEERGDRYIEGEGQRLERRQRRGDGAVLDLGEHAGREPRHLRQIDRGEIELGAQRPNLRADRGLERNALQARRRRAGGQCRCFLAPREGGAERLKVVFWAF